MVGLRQRYAVIVACVLGLTARLALSQKPAPPVAPPQKIETEHLPNAYRITDKVISGGLPEGASGFAELQALGVKTVISVDGITPDVEGAEKCGLRYVHLPHGYDRVPVERGQELAKAVRDLPGPIYIHCHHGKHRSPAAAGVACVEAGLIPPQAGEAILKSAGTSPNYRGLFESVRNARPMSAAELDQLNVEFRQTSPIPPLAEAMVQLEHALDRVKSESDRKWRRRENAQAAALLLLEHYKEMQRLDDVKKRPAKFKELLTASEEAAIQLQTALAGETIDPQAAESALKAINRGCTECHTGFRDNVR